MKTEINLLLGIIFWQPLHSMEEDSYFNTPFFFKAVFDQLFSIVNKFV
jgi:hypothetical protein